MSVSHGQKATAQNFNNAYPSKTVDDTIPSIWDMTNIDPASGEDVFNVQKSINEASAKTYDIQQIASLGSINLDNVKGTQNRLIQSDGGDITLNSTPFGAAGGWADGTEVRIVGGSALNRCVLEHSDEDYGVIINGTMTFGLYDAITLVWFESLLRWIEIIPRNS